MYREDAGAVSLNGGLSGKIFGATATADIRQNVPEKRTSYGVGAEIPICDLVFLRGGYLHSNNNGEKGSAVAKGLAGGFGIKVSALTLDYAITSMGELGYSHRATLSLNF